MYCSGCGTQIQTGLNYCSRCGRRVVDENQEANSLAKSLTGSLGYIGGFGFFGFIFVILALTKNGVDGGKIIPIAFFYFAALFGICYMILRQSNILAKGPKAGYSGQPQAEERAYLKPVTTAQLNEPAERPASVTEHTTRTLDHVPIERNN